MLDLGPVSTENLYFQAIAEHSADLITWIDEELRHRYANGALCRTARRTPEQLIGLTHRELGLPETFCAAWDEHLRLAFSTGEARDFEATFPTPGGPHHYHVQLIPVPAARMVLAISRAITERKEAERQLQTSHSLLRSTLEATTDAILVVGTDGAISIYNQHFLDMWHLTHEHMVGPRMGPCISDQLRDPDGFRRRVNELYDQPEVVSEDLLELKDGRLIERNSFPQRQGDQVVGRVWCYRDVTQRKRAEAELKESQQALSLIVSNLPGMAYRCRNDEGWTIEFASEGCLALTGYPASDFMTGDRAFGDLIHPEDREMVWTEVQDALGQDRPFELEYRIRTAQGEEKWVWEQGRAMGEQPPHGRMLEGFISDITERKQHQAEMARKSAEIMHLQEMERLKSDFLNAASHELRTPLTSIRGYAEFLEDGIGGMLSETQLSFVNQIQQGAQRLRRIVDDMLDFARLEAGSFQLVVQEADLSDLVRSELLSMVPQATEAGLTLEELVAPDSVRLPMDAKRIGQVVLNLVGNAIKFTPRGGSIRVSVQAHACSILVEVTDTGQGIDAEHLPHVFKKFFQVDPSLTREHSGAGLGLAISKALVEAHGGTIGATSKPGSGSTFWFTLPVTQAT